MTMGWVSNRTLAQDDPEAQPPQPPADSALSAEPSPPRRTPNRNRPDGTSPGFRIDGDPGQPPPVPGQTPENATLFRRPAVIWMNAECLKVAHDCGGHGGGPSVQAGVNQLSDPNLDFPWSELDDRQVSNHPMPAERSRVLLNIRIG